MLPTRPSIPWRSRHRYQYWVHFWGLAVLEKIQAQFPSKISSGPSSRRQSKYRYQYWVHFWGLAVPENDQAQFPSTISMQTFPACQKFPGRLSRYFKISLAILVAYPRQNPQIPGHMHGIFFIPHYAICDMYKRPLRSVLNNCIRFKTTNIDMTNSLALMIVWSYP